MRIHPITLMWFSLIGVMWTICELAIIPFISLVAFTCFVALAIPQLKWKAPLIFNLLLIVSGIPYYSDALVRRIYFWGIILFNYELLFSYFVLRKKRAFERIGILS